MSKEVEIVADEGEEQVDRDKKGSEYTIGISEIYNQLEGGVVVEKRLTMHFTGRSNRRLCQAIKHVPVAFTPPGGQPRFRNTRNQD